jgi:hypothetical protein
MPQHPHDGPELNLLCRTDIFGLHTSVIHLCNIVAGKRMTRGMSLSVDVLHYTGVDTVAMETKREGGGGGSVGC